MKFPRFPGIKPRYSKTGHAAEEHEIALPREEPGGSPWSTALLMVGSALVGATAVAVWNRRTIANIRSQFELGAGTRRNSEPGSGHPPRPDEISSADDIF